MTRLQCLLVGSAATEPFVHPPALLFGNELARVASARITVCVLPPLAAIPVLRLETAGLKALRPEADRMREITRLATFETQKLIGNRGSAADSLLNSAASPSHAGRLTRLARVSDLSVLDAAECTHCPQRAIIEEVLFESGRPVVIVPQSGGNPTPERITIAWDGSAHCSRAINDALPFLQSADEVSIVTVAGEKDLSTMTPGEDLANYLVMKGVAKARVEMLTAPDGNVADRLRRYTQQNDTEMLIMGAALHPRYHDMVTGSVTGAMLEHSPTILFLAH